MRLRFCSFVAVAAILATFYSFGLHAGDRPARDRAHINDVYVIHFVLDGLNREMFDKVLSEGKLPTVQKLFIDGGARFTQAVTDFPSTSTAVYQSFATGLFAGHAGIPHLERFDRQNHDIIGYLTVSGHAKLDTDLINLRALVNPEVADLDAPTSIFDLLQGYPTAAIYTSFHHGASYSFPKKAPIAALWNTYVTGDKEHVDVLAMREVMNVFKRADAKIPRYSLVGLYSADILGHSHGPKDESVATVLVQFDLFLKAFVELLERRGIADKTYIIVSADHGMHESGELFNFQKAIEDSGVLVKPKDPRVKNYTLYAANRGVASSHIYVKHDGGFAPLTDPDLLRYHPKIGGGTVDLIDLILGLDATDLLIVRAGERKARIFSRDGGKADVSCYTIDSVDYCSYEYDHGQKDPLGYSSEKSLAGLMDGKPHSSLAWLKASADLHYPDAVIQFSQIFEDGRSGDAFITTKERWGFRKVKAGNHGGAEKDDMRIPMLMAGPMVVRGSAGVMRAVDVYPLLLKWFGLDNPSENYDGVDPFIATGAEDSEMQKLASLEQAFDRHPPLLKMIGVEDFVRREVYPILGRAKFHDMLNAARLESARRSRLVSGLRTMEKDLIAQKERRAKIYTVNQEYLEDHIAIAQRTLRWADDRMRRMEDIVSVLSGKRE